MDQQAFTQAVSEHRDRIFTHAAAVLRDDDDAADVTQEAFLRLWRRGADLPPPVWRPWLLRVVHNLCLDQKRRQGAQRRNFGRPDPDAAARLADPAGAAAGPDGHLQRDDLREEILAALGTLTPETRSVMMMHYFQGMKIREIAAALDKNLNSVKVQIHRARKALRLVLDQEVAAVPAAEREKSG